MKRGVLTWQQTYVYCINMCSGSAAEPQRRSMCVCWGGFVLNPYHFREEGPYRAPGQVAPPPPPRVKRTIRSSKNTV